MTGVKKLIADQLGYVLACQILEDKSIYVVDHRSKYGLTVIVRYATLRGFVEDGEPRGDAE